MLFVFCTIYPERFYLISNTSDERKDKKYYNLVAAASKNDWSLHQHSIEVATLGTCGINLKESVLQRTLGLSKSKSRKVETRCSEIAKHCSHIIWNNRFNRLFNEPLWRNPDGLKGLGLAFPTQKKKKLAPARTSGKDK